MRFLLLLFISGAALGAEPFVITNEFLAHFRSYSSPRHEFSEKTLGFDAIETALAKHHPKSVEEFVRWMKTNGHGDYFKSFALMAHSLSTQRLGATPRRPRILLHQDRLFMGLSGEPGDSHSKKDVDRVRAHLFQTVELIELSTKDRKWHFAELHFPEGKLERDPRRCKVCHGDVPRPIWATYDLWPGAYGGGGRGEDIDASPKELAEFTAFKKDVDDGENDPTLERYRALVFPRPLFQKNRKYGLNGLPNHHLFVHISYLNFLRIDDILREQANLAKIRYAMLAAFSKCPDEIESYLAKPFAKMDYPKLLTETRDDIRLEYADRVKLYNLYNETNYAVDHFEMDSPDRGNAEIMAKLRYLVEGQGVPMLTWGTSFNPNESYGSYNFGVSDSNAFTIFMYVRDIFLPAFHKADPLLKLYLPDVKPNLTPTGLWSQFPRRGAYCEYLKKRSLEETATLTAK